MRQHIDDILVMVGVCVVAYGIAWWSEPASIVLLGVAIVSAGLLIGRALRRRP